jgi:hypothetical protein
MPISACLQLPLPFELVNEFDVAKQVPHLLMMLLTAFSHIVDNDDDDNDDDAGQPVTNNRPNTTAAKARFMAHPPGKLSPEYSASAVPSRNPSPKMILEFAPTSFVARRGNCCDSGRRTAISRTPGSGSSSISADDAGGCRRERRRSPKSLTTPGTIDSISVCAPIVCRCMSPSPLLPFSRRVGEARRGVAPPGLGVVRGA